MKSPTIEQIDALIRREFPGYRLDPGSKIEVAEGRITTYRGEVPTPQPHCATAMGVAASPIRRQS